jgi:protein SCO1/2
MTTLRTLLLWLAFCLTATPMAALATTTPGGDFTLHTPQGKAVSLASLQGRVVLLYFGFTYCPEMCPTELLQFQRLLSLLPADQRALVQPIFVSVDPKRDTPDVLVPYIGHFGKEILALTGSEPELRKVADQYGAQFRYVPTGSSYTVDHTVNTYLIDRTGKLVQIIPYGTPTKEILKLVSRLLP